MSPRKGLRQSREGRRLVELRVGTSDEALLAGLANGDREAAAAFVRLQKRVYGLALSIVGDAGTAEDVAQEAFTRAWRRADGYDARRGRVLTWLLAITRSAAIDVVRLRRAQPMDPELLATRLQLEENAASTGADGGLAERELLRDALAELPVEQQRAIVLATYFGRTAGEIGQLEGVPLGTAKTRIRTALTRLRGTLEEVADER
jgi:RNA polymerase sigma factor (sigma-70 family)